jgi:macrolide-specific efflux system membrane fusion protein
MTTQVFFVTSQAENVLTVPLGALTFTDTPSVSENGARSGRGREGAPNREELAAASGQFPQGGEITPEMRERFEQMRQNGGFEGGGRGGFPGGDGGFPGGFGDSGQGAGGAAAGGSILGSITLNEPRNATVDFVQPDGTRVKREVVVGASDRVNAEVISGLEEGDRVVAGVIQERLEEDEESNNNNSGWRGPPGGMRGFF